MTATSPETAKAPTATAAAMTAKCHARTGLAYPHTTPAATMAAVGRVRPTPRARSASAVWWQ